MRLIRFRHKFVHSRYPHILQHLGYTRDQSTNPQASLSTAHHPLPLTNPRVVQPTNLERQSAKLENTTQDKLDIYQELASLRKQVAQMEQEQKELDKKVGSNLRHFYIQNCFTNIIILCTWVMMYQHGMGPFAGLGA